MRKLILIFIYCLVVFRGHGQSIVIEVSPKAGETTLLISVKGDGTHFLSNDGRAAVNIQAGEKNYPVNYFVPQTDSSMEATVDLWEATEMLLSPIGSGWVFSIQNKADGKITARFPDSKMEEPDSASGDGPERPGDSMKFYPNNDDSRIAYPDISGAKKETGLSLKPGMGFTGDTVSIFISARSRPKFNQYLDSLVVSLHSLTFQKPNVKVLGPTRLLVEFAIPPKLFPGLHTVYVYSGPSMNTLLEQGDFMVIGSKVIESKLAAGLQKYGKEFTIEFSTFHTKFLSPGNIPKVTLKGSAYFYTPSFTADKIEVLGPEKFRAHFTIPSLSIVMDKMKTAFKPEYVEWSYEIESPREGIIQSNFRFQILP